MDNQNDKNTDALELSFDSPKGLVFETENGEKSTAEVKNTQPSGATEQKGASGVEEFGVPEAFSVNEKYNTPGRSNERTRIYTTYVPRFTEASETYRMKDDPRPLPKIEAPEVSAEDGAHAHGSVRAVKVDELPERKEKEIDVNAETVRIGEVGVSSDDTEEESFNMYKFPVEDLSEADRMNVEEENANRKALEEHKARKAEKRAREEAERLAAEEAERAREEAARNTPLEPEKYDIPDPERTGFVGKERAAAIDADYEVPHGIPTDSEKSRKLRMSEYTASGQRDSFKDRFLDSLFAMKIRICALALLSLISMFLGNAEFFGLDVPHAFGMEYVPSALAIIDFYVVLCAFLIVIPEMVMAVSALYNKVFLPEISLLISFAVISVYTLLIVSFNYMGYPVFGFLFVLSALVAIIAAYFKKKADFECFKFVSAKTEKKIIEQEETRKYARTMLALDGAIDGYKSSTAKIFRTTFVSDFFKNSSKTSENAKNHLIMLASAFGAALVSALVAFFTAESNGMAHAASAFTLVLLFSTPLAFFLVHKLSYYHAGIKVAEENSAVVGEYAYTDISGIDVMAFEDTEIFGEDDVNLKRFGFYGNEDNMNRSMRLISSLFASVGGPLHVIFSKTLEKRCTPATNPVIEEDGVSGNVDGKIVRAGNADYMHRHGIKIPEDRERSYGTVGAESMKVMYGAEDGVVFAKFYIRYSFSEEFTSLLASLREEHIVPLVYTSDPNVSNELLRTLAMGADRMRVMKRTLPRDKTEKIYPRLSANAVTTGGVVNAIKLVLLAKKYRHFMDKLEKAGIITMASSAALAALLAVFGFSTVPTVILGAIQLAVCGVLWYFSRKEFDISKRIKEIENARS